MESCLVKYSPFSTLRSTLFLHFAVALYDREDIGLAHDEDVLAIDGDLGARVFAVEDVIADLHADRGELAALIELAWASSRPVNARGPS